MAKQSYPFGTSPIPSETEWELIARAFQSSGVLSKRLNKLEVYADSTGLRVKVKSGEAILEGHFFRSDAEEILAIAANGSGNPRIDRIVAELDRVGGVVDLKVLSGTPAASPSAPAITQSTSGFWQVPLAQVAVANAASTIAAGNVTDERMYAGNQKKSVIGTTAPTLTSTSMADLPEMVLSMWTKGGDIRVDGSGVDPVLSVAGGAFGRIAAQLDGGGDQIIATFQPTSAGFSVPVAGHYVFENVAAGFHTAKLRYVISSGNVTIAQWRRMTMQELLD